jgi:hypothetical protein
MAANCVIDINELMQDLRSAVAYASQMGLLRDRYLFDILKAADQSAAQENGPDLYTLMPAMNELALLIAPVTFADLRFGRNPISATNQRKTQIFQFLLTLCSLLTLLLIGFFMQNLKIEQEALQQLITVQESQPQLKLTALRKMAQYDEPMVKQSTLYDEFHRQTVALKELSMKVNSVYTEVQNAYKLPLFPFDKSQLIQWITPNFLNELSDKREQSNQTQNTSEGAADEESGTANPNEFCAQDSKGFIKIPKEAAQYPFWMKSVISDTFSDFCFQLKVLFPDKTGASLNQSVGEQLTYIPRIKWKISLRVAWFLPFLYGLLGSSIFLMRNLASVRSPAMQPLSIIMRVALGGVAGIVIGWFASSAVDLKTTSSLSVPFALAFLTGYGIEVLFTILDRLNQLIAEVPRK